MKIYANPPKKIRHLVFPKSKCTVVFIKWMGKESPAVSFLGCCQRQKQLYEYIAHVIKVAEQGDFKCLKGPRWSFMLRSGTRQHSAKTYRKTSILSFCLLGQETKPSLTERIWIRRTASFERPKKRITWKSSPLHPLPWRCVGQVESGSVGKIIPLQWTKTWGWNDVSFQALAVDVWVGFSSQTG